MAETPNHGYNVPDAGTQDWHEPVNENFEAFEVDIEIRDAGDPGDNDYDPADGAKYLDTDTGTVYLGDGSSWSEAFSFGGGGGSGIESLTGGEGIDPTNIGDDDTLSVAWDDADVLDANGAVADWSGAADLNGSGSVTANFVASLSGGDGVSPGSIGDGDTVSVAWNDAADLASDGSVDQLSGALTGGQALTDIAGTNLSIDSNGQLNASGGSGGGISSLTGGDGISPDSIGDGDTLSVAPADIAGTALEADGSGNIAVSSGGIGSTELASGAVTSTELSDGTISTADIGPNGASDGHVLRWNGSAWETGFPGTTGSSAVFELEAGGDTLLQLDPNDAGDPNVVAGTGHTVSSFGVTVGGGVGNEASASDATVSGGNQNTASGPQATVGGGFDNTASGPQATVGGGDDNEGTGSFATIAGGTVNKTTANSATVGGGQLNEALADFSTIAGGAPSSFNNPEEKKNVVYDRYGTVGGGGNNQAGDDDGDQRSAEYATVGGGRDNTASGQDAAVAGGNGNTASSQEATVAGGLNNTASGLSATVGGGDDNMASAFDATVGGGFSNEVSGGRATVGGGRSNMASSQGATVAGGEGNTASADYATVAGGLDNTASGQYSFAVGRKATANNDGALVFGDSSSTEISSDGSDQARFQMPVYLPALDGALTGNQELTDIAGNNLSISGGQLNASTSEITSLTGGDGISPGTITDGDTLSVVPADIAGTGLEDDGSGNLAVSAGGIGTSELSTPFADLATLFGDPITTGGTVQSSGALTINTDGANGGRRALELGVPKKGDMDFFEAGGNVVAGHPNNTVNNDARGVVIGGGGAALSGNGNTAGADWATVSGGDSNTASGENSTVGGGNSNDATGDFATIPGGLECEASGSTSFAAGYRAKATNDNTFVWADSSVSDFSSTGADQFLVEASGGTGIGTNDPVTTFHVQDSVAESGGENLGRHVAAIENTSSSSSPVPDVLGLELMNVTDPDEFNSYISFMDSTGTIGNIQGDGNGGVEFVGSVASSAADFAEFFPKADPDREFADGTVVGLDDGKVVALDTESDPDAVLVVSAAPLVAGNRPIDEDERDAYVKLSLVGQVPVWVSASVDHGDVLVADDDGTAIARTDCDEAGSPVVGMALGEAEAGETVRSLIGGPGVDTTPTSRPLGQESADRNTDTETQTAREEPDERESRIADLEAENERLRDANEQLREQNADLEARLAAVEDHLGLGDSGTTTQGVADD